MGQMFPSRTLKLLQTRSSLEVVTWNFRKVIDAPLFVISLAIWLSVGGFTASECLTSDDPGLTSGGRAFLGIFTALWLVFGALTTRDSYLKTFSIVKCLANDAGIRISQVAPFFQRETHFPWNEVIWVTHTVTTGRLYAGLTIVLNKKTYDIDDLLKAKLAEQAAERLDEMRVAATQGNG